MKRIFFFAMALAIFHLIFFCDVYGGNTSRDFETTNRDSANSFLEFLGDKVYFHASGHFRTVQRETMVTPNHRVYRINNQIVDNAKYSVPFHGAYLLHLRNTIIVSDNFLLQLRLIFEGRSFSRDYLDFDNNSVMWSKVSGFYWLSFSGLSGNDTLLLRMGDLERCRCGEGIALDEYEGEGYSLTYSFSDFRFRNTHIGRGLSSEDDMVYSSFSYGDRVYVNLLANYNTNTSTLLDFPIIYEENAKEYYQVISSVSLNLPVYAFSSSYLSSQINFFAEGALSDDHRDRFQLEADYSAFLIGMRNESRIKKNTYQVEFQYRNYASEFNLVNANRVSDQPFTQLSLDKRFNNWFNYLRAPGDISGINVWGSFKQYMFSLCFLEGTTEYLKTRGAINQSYFFYEAGIGVELSKNLVGDFFLTNRIINPSVTGSSLHLERRSEFPSLGDGIRQEPTFIQTKETLWGVRMRFQF